MPPRPKKDRTLLDFPARLLTLIGEQPYSEFERSCGLKRNSVNDMLKGKDPSREKLESIIRGIGCNAQWLITGEGEPFGDEKSPPASAEGLDTAHLTRAQASFARDIAFLQSALSGLLTASLDSPLFAQQYAENVRALRAALEKLAAAVPNPPAS